MAERENEPVHAEAQPGHTAAEVESSASGLRALVVRHPWASATLLASVVLGAAISAQWVTGDLSLTRRLVGGAIFGGLAWLLVMVGRVI